jgi:MFS family permease
VKQEKTGLIIMAMALGLLMASLDNTITSAAISHIIKDIGGFEKMSWVIAALAAGPGRYLKPQLSEKAQAA